MTGKSLYHGGIVFRNDRPALIDQFCRIVTATLEDYGHRVERQSAQESDSAVVVTSLYRVELTLREDHSPSPAEPAGAVAARRQRLVISMAPADDRYEDRDISELMLVVMLYRMVDIFNAESIEWMDPATILTVEQFLSAFTNVSPHRVRGYHALQTPAERFAPVDAAIDEIDDRYDIHAMAADAEHGLSEEERLAMAFRCDDLAEDEPSDLPRARNDIRRLAVWAMTGMVAMISAPVAASLAAVNLARGEDLRLNTQVLSFAGLVAVLSSTGLLAQLVQNLPI